MESWSLLNQWWPPNSHFIHYTSLFNHYTLINPVNQNRSIIDLNKFPSQDCRPQSVSPVCRNFPSRILSISSRKSWKTKQKIKQYRSMEVCQGLPITAAEPKIALSSRKTCGVFVWVKRFLFNNISIIFIFTPCLKNGTRVKTCFNSYSAL